MRNFEQIQSAIFDFCLAQVGNPYVYGGTGQYCTPAYRRARAAQYPGMANAIRANCPVLSGRRASCAGCKWNGKRAFDCAQLTRFAVQAAGLSPLPSGATSQWNKAGWARKGTIDSLPMDELAILYRRNGAKMQHTGVYLGDGTFVDARGHAAGVMHRPLSSYRWTHWAQLPGMSKRDASEPPDAMFIPSLPPPSLPNLKISRVLRYIEGRPMLRGKDIRFVQQALINAGISVGPKGPDGVYGPKTAQAVRRYQEANGLTVDGIAGRQTLGALGLS